MDVFLKDAEHGSEADLVTTFQVQHLTGFFRGCNLIVQILQNPADLFYLSRIADCQFAVGLDV